MQLKTCCKTNDLGFASSEDSDQLGNLPSLINLHSALNGYLRTLAFFMGAVRTYNDQGQVVQSIVSLMTPLKRQLVKYMPTKLSNPLLFFVEEM